MMVSTKATVSYLTTEEPGSEIQNETSPAVRLGRIAAAVHAGIPPDAGDMLWMANVLDRVLIGAPAEAAFGIKRGPGQRKLETCAALTERDRLIREAANRFFPGRSMAEQAQRLRTVLSRFEASAWVRERVLNLCPERHVGTIQESLWRVLKHHDRVLSVRSLRDILARS